MNRKSQDAQNDTVEHTQAEKFSETESCLNLTISPQVMKRTVLDVSDQARNCGRLERGVGLKLWRSNARKLERCTLIALKIFGSITRDGGPFSLVSCR